MVPRLKLSPPLEPVECRQTLDRRIGIVPAIASLFQPVLQVER